MLGIYSYYCEIVSFLDSRLPKCHDLENPGKNSLKVIESGNVR